MSYFFLLCYVSQRKRLQSPDQKPLDFFIKAVSFNQQQSCCVILDSCFKLKRGRFVCRASTLPLPKRERTRPTSRLITMPSFLTRPALCLLPPLHLRSFLSYYVFARIRTPYHSLRAMPCGSLQRHANSKFCLSAAPTPGPTCLAYPWTSARDGWCRPPLAQGESD